MIFEKSMRPGRTPPAPRQGDPGQALRAEPGELANVRLWLEADLARWGAECPLVTHSGHSVEYAVQQVGIENQCFAYTRARRASPSLENKNRFPGTP